jgi:hypothetical protein
VRNSAVVGINIRRMGNARGGHAIQPADAQRTQTGSFSYPPVKQFSGVVLCRTYTK